MSERLDSFTADQLTRFWLKVDKSKGCWLWTPPSSAHGYGQLKINGRPVAAHRISWVIHNGQIPLEAYVLHRCDVRNCVNPDHLFIGSHEENMRDMIKKGRHSHPKGEKNSNAKLTEMQIYQIRELYDSGGYTYKSISELYGVKSAAIGKIVGLKTWGHLPRELHPVNMENNCE